MNYAAIVVNLPIRRYSKDTEARGAGEQDFFPGPIFHYIIPASLQGQLQVGHLVIVPFGPRRVQGIVVELLETTPVAQEREMREVEALAYPDPVVSPRQVALARWMSATYLAPLADCLNVMLPPGLWMKPRAVYEVLPPSPSPQVGRGGGEEGGVGVRVSSARLTPLQREILSLLRQTGPLDGVQIRRRLRKRGVLQALRQLVRRGLLTKHEELPPPRVRPRRVRFVRLVADEEQIAAATFRLGHPSKRAAVLIALLESPDPLPSLRKICQQADCSPNVVRALQEEGYVEIIPAQQLVISLLSPAELEQAIAGLGKRAYRQRAVLEALRRQGGGPVSIEELQEQTGASSSTLKALEERGYIRRWREEPAVLLRLSPEDTRQVILRLRGAEKQAAVLDYLRTQDEAVWVSWVYAETGCDLDDLRALENLGLVELSEREMWRDPLAGKEFVPHVPPRLTPDQETVWRTIEAGLLSPSPNSQSTNSQSTHLPITNLPLTSPPTYLLHGVTGSGKTEIYLRAVETTLNQGRQAIVLVPEISLTPQTIRRFAARFPGRLTVLHSHLSLGERYDTWRRIRAGLVDLVIGPRSALFAPLPRLGLIILDEEHSDSYKQERSPCYHARDVARHLARLTGAVLILGSATPDVVTYYRARRGEYTLLELPQRIMAHRRRVQEQQARYHVRRVRYRPLSRDYADVTYTDLPPVQVVDLRQELRAGNRHIFSRALQSAMHEALAQGEQIILFLNRRGAATFVLCRDCGHVLKCPRCDVPLTYHTDQEELICHHCDYREPIPRICPQCGGPRIRYFGLGTQRVEKAVHELFPQARTLRWDLDTTGGKWAHEALLTHFINHEADVLIGTQMIAKGLDLPLVTLVGVVSADTALHLPDYRAGERTFQLLTQVAGRAGRGLKGGQVIVQTYNPEHYAIRYAARHDYRGFYDEELRFRQRMGYPPFGRLVRLLYRHSRFHRCREEARYLSYDLRERLVHLDLEGEIDLIGPAPCFLSRLRGKYRWQIVVRGRDPLLLLRGMALPPGWQVDVDPVNLL